jgi:hypothetical protein
MSAIIGSVRAHTKLPPSGSSARGAGRGNVTLIFFQLLGGPPRFHLGTNIVGNIERVGIRIRKIILRLNMSFFEKTDFEFALL